MKERYITRTIKGTIATVKAINIKNDEITTKEYSISYATESKDEIKEYITTNYKDIVPLIVIDVKPFEQLYVMKESFFIENATPVTDRASIKDIGEG